MTSTTVGSAAAAPALHRTPRRARTSGPLLPVWWPIAALTVGYPVWWALGLSAVAYPLVALLLIPSLLHADRIRVPRGFALWMAFLAWVLLSTTQLGSLSRFPSFAYRASVYFAATVLFLWVYNIDRRRLSTERVISLLVGLWSIVAVGGLIGAVLPRLQFSSALEMVLPQRAFSNPLVYQLVHPEFAQVSRLLGRELGRPTALFPYTNGWGSTFGILFPVVIAWLLHGRSTRGARMGVMILLALSVVSVVSSLNRGLWLSLIVGVAYVIIRLVTSLRLRTVVLSLIPLVGFLAILALTPLGDVVGDRSENGHSDEARSSLYEQSIDRGLERPFLGWGSPQERTDKDSGPSVGTHGQVWLILVSQGLVGLLLYLSWWANVIARSWRQRTTWGLWLHAAVVVVVLQSIFYEHTPIQLPLAMIIAALLLRSPVTNAKIETNDQSTNTPLPPPPVDVVPSPNLPTPPHLVRRDRSVVHRVRMEHR